MAISRFLIVDDTSSNALFFQMILKDLGFEKHVHVTGSGSEGLLISEEKHIQFIITAWEMKTMPGTTFVQKARNSRHRKHLPCLIYSKRMNNEDAKLTQELGFQNILTMPFDKNMVHDTIEGIIKQEENLDPKEAKLRRMEDYLIDNKPGEALKLIDNTLFRPGPKLIRALTLRANIWIQMTKIDKAKADIEQALGEDPDDFQALQIKAKLLSKEGRHDEAIGLLTQMTEKSPKNMMTMVNLGTAFVRADRHDEARDMFKKVMDIDDDNQSCKDGMAEVEFKEGNMSLAVQLITETENGNELAAIFNNLAISHVSKGEFDKGIEIYLNAIGMLTDKAKLHLLHYNLGLAYRKKGDLQKSFDALSESYLQQPSFEKAYVALARLTQEMKKNGVPYSKSVINDIKKARQIWKSDTGQKAA